MVPQSRPLTLLLTRPRAQSERFAAELGLHMDVEIAPLIEIVPGDPGDIGQARGLIFTSENGVAAAEGLARKDLRAFCVGPRTAARAQRAGFDARCLGGTADNLVAALKAKGETGPLLHLHGEHTRGDVAERLTAAGLPTEARQVYAQDARDLPHDLRTRLAGGAAMLVPLFSPRSTALFCAQVPDAPGAEIVCLSRAVAEALRGHFAGIEVCESPNGQSMREALYRRVTGNVLEAGDGRG